MAGADAQVGVASGVLIKFKFSKPGVYTNRDYFWAQV